MFFRLLGRLFFYFVNIMGCSSLVIKKKNLLEKLLGGSVTFTEPNNTFYDIIMSGSTIIDCRPFASWQASLLQQLDCLF